MKLVDGFCVHFAEGGSFFLEYLPSSSIYSHLTIPQITHYWPSSSFLQVLQVPTRKKGWEIIRSIATNLRGGGGGGGGGGGQILCFVKVTHGKMIGIHEIFKDQQCSFSGMCLPRSPTLSHYHCCMAVACIPVRSTPHSGVKTLDRASRHKHLASVGQPNCWRTTSCGKCEICLAAIL